MSIVENAMREAGVSLNPSKPAKQQALQIIKLLQDINESGTTIIMATHNADIVNSLRNRTLVIEKGKLTKDQHSKHKKEHEEHAKEVKQK